MQHQISNYTFTIFDKFQYENRTEKQGQFSCKNAGQKSLWFNYIYIFLNKVFSQVSEHTYIVLQESKGKKKKHLTIRFSRQITVIKNYPLHLHTTTKNYKLNVCQNIRETHLCFKKKKWNKILHLFKPEYNKMTMKTIQSTWGITSSSSSAALRFSCNKSIYFCNKNITVFHRTELKCFM